MFGFFGDIHIRDTGSFLPYHKINNSGLTYELENILTSADFVVEMIKKYRFKAIFILGDIFDDLNFLSKRTLYVSGLYFNRIKEVADRHNTKIYIIPGNHDTSLEINDNIISYLKPFSYYGEVIETLTDIEIDGVRFTLLPYTKNSNNIERFLNSNSDILVTHLEFNGFTMDNGYPTNGIEYTGKDKKIVSGHLHLRQLNEFINIYYPGSIIQNKFHQTDLSGVGGMLIYDGKDLSFQENYISKHYIKVIDLNALDSLDSDKCLIKVILECEYKDIKDKLKDYDHMFVRKYVRDDVKRTVINPSTVDPKRIFYDRMHEMGEDYIIEAKGVLE